MRWTRTWLTATSSVPARPDRSSPLAGGSPRASVPDVLAGALAGAVVASAAAVDGGYFPTAWGWSSLALLLVAAATLIVADRVHMARLDAVLLTALAALVLWIALSALWSASVPRTLLEVERGIVYVAGAAALLLLARRGATAWIAAGLLAATTAVSAYALATRLFPERFGYDFESGYQLARPLGYWNALGILAALGILLALGFAASVRRALSSAAAAALPVLVATLYFTFSRGAVVALAVGLVVMLAIDPRRLRLAVTGLALAPLGAVAVALGSSSEGLAREQAPIEVASREGHRLALAIVVLAACAALVQLGLGWLGASVDVPERVRRATGVALLAVTAAAALAGLVAVGGPVALVTRAYDSFHAPLPASSGELEGRLFSVSGNGRADYWRVALDAYRDDPVLGSGAGTYELHWMRERPTAFNARDAHSLYLETLSELGPVGLALILVALGAPLLAVGAARRTPLGSAAAGGYVAYLAHAALDWDWELPAVTLAALACAVALLVARRSPADERLIANRARVPALAVIAVAAVFGFVAFVGNSALAVADDAATEGDYARAVAEARRATRWTPWASDTWEALGEAQLALGEEADARRSFQRAIERDPDDWSLWFGLARASVGPDREAALERTRQLNPRG
jgi:O-antigen ligase